MNVNRLSQDLIRLYNQRDPRVSSGGDASSTGPLSSGTAEAASGTGGAADSVSLSDHVRDLARVLSIVKSTPDVRESVVRSLRRRIVQGTYTVSADRIASRLLSARQS